MIAINKKMPVDCRECDFENDYYGCIVNDCKSTVKFNTHRPDWCPLHSVECVMCENLFTQEEIERYGEDFIKTALYERAKERIGWHIANTPNLMKYREMNCPDSVSMDGNEVWIRTIAGVLKFENSEMEDTEKWSK